MVIWISVLVYLLQERNATGSGVSGSEVRGSEFLSHTKGKKEKLKFMSYLCC